jgi:hypothetical protein
LKTSNQNLIIKESTYNHVLGVYTFKNRDLFYDFINQNTNLIDLLKITPPIIRNYFPNEELSLEFAPDPEIDMDQLLLIQKPMLQKKIMVNFSKK